MFYTVFQGNWSSTTTHGFYYVCAQTNNPVNGYPSFACGIFQKIRSGGHEAYFVNCYNGDLVYSPISFSVPDFYKNYNSLAELKAALAAI